MLCSRIAERRFVDRQIKPQAGEKAISIFEFKFFQDGNFKDWTGKESIKELYSIYSKTKKLIMKKNNDEIIL